MGVWDGIAGRRLTRGIGWPETEAAMETLRIRLFGELDLRLGEAPLPALDSARAESLLAYLLLHRDAPQSRERLAFLLWPDSSEPQARTNLRHVLHKLRRALPEVDRFLEVTPRTLRWRDDAPFALDVADFEAALARTDGDPVAALREAARAYTGDLLEGSYEDWLLEERERLRQQHLDALERLATLLAERDEHAEAIGHAERLLRHDPLREETYRLLMRLHDARGDRARALRVYHACAATLARELGVEPAAPTRAAYEVLLPEPAAVEEAPAGPVLVGREPERSRLMELWHASERGRAQLVLVTGEPGIGKTRLVEELRAWCARRGAITAEARSYPAEGALAFGPVVEWLRAEPLAAHRPRLPELARVLPELDLPLPEPLPDAEQRQRLFGALAAAIHAAPGPLLLVANDVHWADRETLRFLHYLVRSAPGAALLVAATARREELDGGHPLHALVTGLRALDRCVEIELGRLSRRETETLAGRLADSALEPAVVERLYARTEGNPLFVVEAVRSDPTADELSPRVQAVIEARLEQLSEPARALVGVAATVGREFTTEVLAAATDEAESELVRALDELWRRRIVHERGSDAYDFSHDTIREVAYRALGPAQRRRAHLAVAGALERSRDLDAVSGELGMHYERGGAAGEAVSWYARAADVAQRRSANADAIRLLERALAQVRGDEARELAVVTAILAPLFIVEGYGSARLHELQQRGLELANRLGIEPEPPLLRSLALTALAAGDYARSRGFGERLRARAERDGDGVLLAESDYALGVSAFWEGELHAARRHFEHAADEYRGEHRATHLIRYGLDPKVVCLSRLSNTLWFLGRPQAAVRRRDEAFALAEEIGHPPTTGTVRSFAAQLAVELRDASAVRACADAFAARPREREVRMLGGTAEVLAGYLEVLDGRTERGLARIRRMLDDPRDTQHAPGYRAVLIRLLAEACAVAGDLRGGIAAAEALLEPRAGARLWEAEAHRLRAEFRAALGEDVRAELELALDVARRQGARSLELRAATSLLRHSGTDDARQRLVAVLAGMPEDADTPDRRDAEALLR